MRTSVTIRRPEGALRGNVALPPSKSVANRALILAALAGDVDCVKNFGTAQDTVILHDLLQRRPSHMHCGDGGTTFRFLLAWACLQKGEERFITGNARLLQRPHAPLVQALRLLGADITETASGYHVRGKRMAGGTIKFDSPVSSQFISALMLVAPCFYEGLELEWTGLRLSTTYVRMTMEMLKQFGANAYEDDVAICVKPGPLLPQETRVPADWSAAAFWFEVAALAPDTELLFEGLSASTELQGDKDAVGLFIFNTHCTQIDEDMILRGRICDNPNPYSANLLETPDLFQPLIFALAGTGKEAEITGLHNLPLKETDRLKAVTEALKTLGCSAEYEGGTFNLSGRITNTTPPPFDPQGDHRMAMALAPLALVCDAITILHPEVVNKSYPGFWEEMKKVGFLVEFSTED
jgi:3-phosphoshikimate 1-carboxyvinyltransferase